MSTPKIRPPSPADAEAMQSIYVRAARSNPGDLEKLHGRALELAARVGPRDWVMVAELAGQPVALSTLSPEGEIRGLFVDPAFQGRGLGRLLAETAEGDARGMDAEALTVVSNRAAVAFWRKLGFRPDGDAPVETGRAPRLTKPLRISAA